MTDKADIGGVILAGGKGSRMGFRDKPMQTLHGRPLLSSVIEKARSQVSELIVSSNSNAENYLQFGLPLVGDLLPNSPGPLVGIYSAMRWYLANNADEANAKPVSYLACFAADVPIFPLNLVEQLLQCLEEENAAVAYAQQGSQIQPLFSLWNLEIVERVEVALNRGLVGPRQLFAEITTAALVCDDDEPGTFFNINTLIDLDTAATLIAKD